MKIAPWRHVPFVPGLPAGHFRVRSLLRRYPMAASYADDLYLDTRCLPPPALSALTRQAAQALYRRAAEPESQRTP